MAVAYDSTGPSSSGQGSAASPLAWTHTASSGGVTILVGVAIDITGPTTASATCDGTSMTFLGQVYPSIGSNTEGGVFLWSISGQASGAHSISVTESAGGLIDMCGGSIAFSGVTGLGSLYTAQAASVAVTSNTGGNIIAGFIGAGDSITADGQTNRFTVNYEGGSGGYMGNCAGSTAAATGSTVTLSWTEGASADAVCCLAVEVQGSATGPALNQGPLPNRPVIVVSNAGWRGAGRSR